MEDKKEFAPSQGESGDGLLEMTPARCAYFLRRFKHDEKMLGPNEQAALDFAIAHQCRSVRVGYGYAGVHIWIGDLQVKQFVSRDFIQHEAVKGEGLTNACQHALDLLAAAAMNPEQK